MERDHIANIILTIMMLTTFSTLYSLGEGRVDAYISMYTLEYFIIKALLKPRRITRDYLAIALFIAFTIIVAIRVMQVLGI